MKALIEFILSLFRKKEGADVATHSTTVINDHETITIPEIHVTQESKYLAFDKNDILPDDWFTSQEKFDIQGLLEKKKSSLAGYKIDGFLFSDLLSAYGSNCKINPKMGFIILEREQSLIRVPVETLASKRKEYLVKNPDGSIVTIISSLMEYRLDWACGFGCPDNLPKDARYRGLGKQIEAAFKRYRDYFTEIETGKYKLNAPYKVDLDNNGKWTDTVSPVNKATFGLYRYCPHIGLPTSPLAKQYGGEYGNYLSWLLAVKVFFKNDFNKEG